MRFSSKQDIEAPLQEVFRSLTDFDAWETAAMRRGADVARTDRLTSKVAGLSWQAKFSYRGKERNLTLKLTEIDQPTHLAFAGQSAAIDGQATVDLLELGARRTRMHLVLEITPRSLAARLFLQSLRLARARIDRKFDHRIAQLAGEIEQRYRGPTDMRR